MIFLNYIINCFLQLMQVMETMHDVQPIEHISGIKYLQDIQLAMYELHTRHAFMPFPQVDYESHVNYNCM